MRPGDGVLTHSDIGIRWRNGTRGDDLGRDQRDRRTAAAGDPGAAAGRRAAGDRPGAGPGDDPAAGVQAPAGPPGGRARAGPRGGQAAAVRAGRPRAAAGPRVGGRLRAALERELRPAGRVRAGVDAGEAGGTTRWRRPVPRSPRRPLPPTSTLPGIPPLTALTMVLWRAVEAGGRRVLLPFCYHG